MLYVRNGLVLAEEQGRFVPREVDLVVEGDRIAGLVPRGQPLAPPGPSDTVLDAAGKIVLPGFVNAHTHVHNLPLKGRVRYLPVEAWMLYRIAGGADWTPEDCYVTAMLGAIDALRTGTTTLVLMVPLGLKGLDAVARAYRDVGIRAVVAPMVADRPATVDLPDGGAALPPATRAWVEGRQPPSAEDGLALCREFARRWHGAAGRITAMVGPSAPHRCSDLLLAGCRDLAAELDIGIQTHLLETRFQPVVAQRLYGGSIVAHLDRLGFLSPRVSLAHAVWLTPDDIATVARSGACIAHNPMSNLNLGSGIAPVPAYLRAGIPVGLGTDGYSGGTHAMFETMRLAAALHTVHTTDYAQWLRPLDVLRLATHGGATAARLAGEVGALAVGRRADLAILGADSPALTPLNDLVDQLVYCESGAAVETVVVNGAVVVQGGRVVTVDEPVILAEARRLAERLAERNRPLFAFAREHEAHIHRAYFTAGDA